MCALFYTHVHAPNVMYIIMYSNFTVSVCIQTHDLTAGGHIATQRSEAAALETAVPPRLSGTHFIVSYTHTHTHTHTHSYNQTIPFLFSLSLSTDSSLTYHNVTAALRTLIDWHSLGVELGVHKSQLDMIEGDYSRTRRRRNELINVWLSNDTQASWRKLCRALEDIDKRALAAEIRSQYCHS